MDTESTDMDFAPAINDLELIEQFELLVKYKIEIINVLSIFPDIDILFFIKIIRVFYLKYGLDRGMNMLIDNLLLNNFPKSTIKNSKYFFIDFINKIKSNRKPLNIRKFKKFLKKIKNKNSVNDSNGVNTRQNNSIEIFNQNLPNISVMVDMVLENNINENNVEINNLKNISKTAENSNLDMNLGNDESKLNNIPENYLNDIDWESTGSSLDILNLDENEIDMNFENYFKDNEFFENGQQNEDNEVVQNQLKDFKSRSKETPISSEETLIKNTNSHMNFKNNLNKISDVDPSIPTCSKYLKNLFKKESLLEDKDMDKKQEAALDKTKRKRKTLVLNNCTVGTSEIEPPKNYENMNKKIQPKEQNVTVLDKTKRKRRSQTLINVANDCTAGSSQIESSKIHEYTKWFLWFLGISPEKIIKLDENILNQTQIKAKSANDEKGKLNDNEPKENMQIAGPSGCQSDETPHNFFPTPLTVFIMQLFPDILPSYASQLCQNYQKNDDVVVFLIDRLLTNEYPKNNISKMYNGDNGNTKQKEQDINQISLEEQIEFLKEMLPNADPSYLETHCRKLYDRPKELRLFIDNLLSNKINYPSRQQYENNLKKRGQIRKYLEDFNVDEFLNLIPDPEAYFINKHKSDINGKNQIALKTDYQLKFYIFTVFKNLFPKIRVADIRTLMGTSNIIEIYEQMKQKEPQLKSVRKLDPLPEINECDNIPLLQEITYILHKNEIDSKVFIRKEQEIVDFEYAKQNKLLVECGCCFSDEILLQKTTICSIGHLFCNECVIKSVEVNFADLKLEFNCLCQCDGEFLLPDLQKILNPILFSKIAQRKQLNEIKAAGIEGLTNCPFCDFASIITPDIKVFKCLNEDCMKESCVECKEVSHVPYRCDEIKNENKVRTYIENKMSEALIRTCWKCEKKFIKSDGCNKMTCSCGALMCYVCGDKVLGYNHFNRPGDDQYEKCPLFNNLEQLHIENVRKEAEKAIKELESQNYTIINNPLENFPQVPKNKSSK